MYKEKQCAIHNTAAKRFESRLIKKYHQAQNIGLRRFIYLFISIFTDQEVLGFYINKKKTQYEKL
jgi:hypothetical protein